MSKARFVFLIPLLILVLSENVAAQCENKLRQQYEKLAPTVVLVKTDYGGALPVAANAQVPQMQTYYAGSGVFIRPDGVILLVEHLVRPEIIKKNMIAPGLVIDVPYKFMSATVFYEGQKFEAKVIGYDIYKKPAILKLVMKTETRSFPYAKLGRGEDLRVGDCIFSIANGHSIEKSLKPGVVAAITNSYNDGVKFIISQIGIVGGDSGGPIFNSRGELVGLNEFLFDGGTTSGSVLLDNFVKESIDKLLAGQAIEHPYFDSTLTDLNKMVKQTNTGEQNAIRSNFDLPENLNEGVMIKEAPPSGFSVGDVVLAVDDKIVRTNFDFFRALDTTLPKQKLHFRVMRHRQMIDIYSAVDVLRIIPNP